MRTVTALFLLSAGLHAAPQAGGFQPGELVLYSSRLTGNSSSSGGVVRIDPGTGAVSTIALLLGNSQLEPSSLCYDPFRDRVVFLGGWPTVDDVKHLWAADAAGNMTDLGLPNTTLSSLTPGAGGRIYARGPSAATPLVYLDAANQLHTLMDAGGTQPFVPPAWDARNLQYHAGLNALFVANFGGSLWGCTSNVHPSVHRILLSDDGARAVSVDACVSMAIDPLGGGHPSGLSAGPGGQILIVVDTNSNAQQPRMQLIDPHTLAVTPFAANGAYVGAAATNAGTWSHVLGRAVVLDTFNDVLRTFAMGETGEGTVVVPSEVLSDPGSSGEFATLVEVPAQPCSGTIGTYCTATTTSDGCVPEITTGGCPSASAGSGFMVRATFVHPTNLGLFLYGTQGPTVVPVLGGILCVASPFLRTPAQAAGGAGVCGGRFAFDFNAWVPVSNDPALVAGAVVHGQYWFRDPPAVFGVGFSGGVTFTLAP
jgi:hypothetical protein